VLSLTVLGCDGSHPGPGGAGSGYLVRSWEHPTVLWLDAGPGTFANLQRFCDPAALDAVILTHEHPDHWSDVASFLVAARHDRPAGRPLRILAPRAVRQWVWGAHRLSEGCTWEVVADGQEVRVGDLSLRFSQTDHPPETLAVRIEGEGSSLGYSADAGPGWSLEALGPGLDLALCEATYTQDYEGKAGHMSGRQAGRSAREAQVGRLVITHRWSRISPVALGREAAEAFGGPVEHAAVGRGFSL
jgi:ribonuclease BN (tRNA processing enzyme)